MSKERKAKRASASASISIDAGVAIDAAPIPADAAPIPIDAATRRSVDAGAKVPEPPDPKDEALTKHLAAAESARRSGNRLRQLAEAEAVLDRDARHTRARFLAGEALLETGDAVNGCKYLRRASKISEARALLSSGRCPGD
jgi:hypothetical protein